MCGTIDNIRGVMDNVNDWHPLSGIIDQPLIDPYLQGDTTANGSVVQGSYLDKKDQNLGLADMQQTADFFAKTIGLAYAGGQAGSAMAGADAGASYSYDPGGEGMYSAPTQGQAGTSGGTTGNTYFDIGGQEASGLPEGSVTTQMNADGTPVMPSGSLTSSSQPGQGLDLRASPDVASSNFPTTFNESSGFAGDPGNLTASGTSANYGPTSMEGGNWYDDFLRRAQKNPLTTGLNGMNVGMGLYGLYQAQQTKALAQRASQQQDPFGPQRAQYQAQLQTLMGDPGSITKTPGYDAGLQAVTRKMASQGYVGSGNMMAALQQYGGQFYDQSVQRLMALSGANISPSSGAVALQGNRDALAMQGQSLNNVVYGLSKMFQ